MNNIFNTNGTTISYLKYAMLEEIFRKTKNVKLLKLCLEKSDDFTAKFFCLKNKNTPLILLHTFIQKNKKIDHVFSSKTLYDVAVTEYEHKKLLNNE